MQNTYDSKYQYSTSFYCKDGDSTTSQQQCDHSQWPEANVGQQYAIRSRYIYPVFNMCRLAELFLQNFFSRAKISEVIVLHIDLYMGH